eukprot:TRINITY_DN8853_c0_g3_i1.p1 TRINITY_DN8853_c0_g3~~TRINITY_DN8853_c0_g3_i1.p1  ORF type:complete len:396 (-),score=95.83 TRINITY_DN8853_c0_g3_i1:129-1316(-)
MNAKRRVPATRKSTNCVIVRKSINLINPLLNRSTANNVPTKTFAPVTARLKENINSQSLEKSYCRPTQCSRMKSNGNVKKAFLAQNAKKKSLNSSRISTRKSSQASPLKELDMNSTSEPKQIQPPITDLEQQTINIIQEYGKEIEHYEKQLEESNEVKDCLAKHGITPQMRAKMINWMVEVLASFKTNDRTFFLSVNTMDRYLKASSRKEASELHLIGVTSMFLASKYEDIQPLRMSTVYEKIGHKKLEKASILECESDILKKLDYFLQAPTVCQFIKKYIAQGPWKSHKSLIGRMSIYFAKMCAYDYSFSETKNSLFAAGVLYVSLKITDQINNKPSSKQTIRSLAAITEYSEDEIINCAQKVLKVTQNFEKLFPGLVNLKKFNPIDLPKYVGK